MISEQVKTDTKELVLRQLEQYFVDAEEAEDDDVQERTTAEERLDDFTEYLAAIGDHS